MSIRAKLEAIIYAAEEPVAFEQIFALAKDEARQELARRRREQESVAAESVLQESTRNESIASEADLAFAPEITATMPTEPTALPEPSWSDESAAQPEDTAEAGNEPATITDAEVKSFLRAQIEELIAGYNSPEHGIEVRQIAGGYRMATKPEQHDVVRAFAKSLKPPIRLSLQALETLAVIAYKQPITAPEISEIRGVDCSGVLGTLLDRKLITTGGRKQVIGRPILYKTTKEFLLHFGLRDVGELPSMEEFEKLAAEALGPEMFAAPTPEQAAAEVATMEAPLPAPPSAEPGEEPARPEPEISPDRVAQQVAAMEAPLSGAPAKDAAQPPMPSEQEISPEEVAQQVAANEAPLPAPPSAEPGEEPAPPQTETSPDRVAELVAGMEAALSGAPARDAAQPPVPSEQEISPEEVAQQVAANEAPLPGAPLADQSPESDAAEQPPETNPDAG